MNIETFYQSHFQSLVEVACRYLAKEDAEDVVQDVLMTLWERREGLAFVEDLQAYAYSSVRHRCLDRMKHEAYKREFCRRTLRAMRHDLDMEMVSNYSPVSGEVEYREMAVRVDHAVSRLPNRCRAIFCMSRFEGLHYKEIGTQLGISENTVECQMTIALRKLRGMLLAG